MKIIMPELPELEGIRKYLSGKIAGSTITDVETFSHTVIRFPDVKIFQSSLTGARLDDILRKGKLLVFHFKKKDYSLFLYIDHGLTGRLAWEKKKVPAKIVFRFHFDSGLPLIYHDRRLHGAIWLYNSASGDKNLSPQKISNYGPDILDTTFDEFQSRIKRYRGEIKGVLTKQEFVTGIGNAYSDEILFHAGIHPFTKRTSLSTAEIEKVYYSCISILGFSTTQITNWLSSTNKLDNQKAWRKELFKIHLKGDQSCHNCGKSNSSIKANRKITNFCRTCQTPRNKNFI